MRRDAREAAYRFLYSFLVTGEKDDELKKDLYREHKIKDKDVAFADTLISAVFEHFDEICGYISRLAVGYNIERINYLDKSALVIAMTEIKYFDDIDVPVSIDEAVRLVKKYSTENSLSFVNGILGEFAKENR